MFNLNFKQFLNEVWDRRMHGDYGSCDVFRNPDKEELIATIEEDWESQIRELGRNVDTSNRTWKGTARGWLTKDEDIYIWAENAFSHEQVARQIFRDPYMGLVAFYISRNGRERGKLELSTSDFSTTVEDPRSVLKSNSNYCKMMGLPEPLIKIKPRLKQLPSLSDKLNHFQKMILHMTNKQMSPKNPHKPETMPKHDLSWFLKNAWGTMADRHKQG